MQNGETPSVLAMSWGRGDYQKDDITIVYLDYEGRMREHTRIDNLTDPDNQDELADLISRRKPEVIVIGGFSMTTTRLAKDLQTFLDGNTSEFAQTTRDKIEIEVKYVFDEVARLFQHSKRAEAEFGALPTLTKYCIGLARYAQSPLNEYASLGEDIVAVSFDERYQHLVRFIFVWPAILLI
jgi:transcription elongation factor SPT6